MEISDVIVKRYAVRDYEDRAVEEDKILRILEAGNLAPSAKNIQERRFVIVKKKELRTALIEACNNQSFIGKAPVIIAGCSVVNDYIMRCGQPANTVDVSISMDHMSLQAVAEGLGSCWIGSFYPEKVRAILGIPPQVSVIQLMTLGYPVRKMFINRDRLRLEKIYSENKWEKYLSE